MLRILNLTLEDMPNIADTIYNVPKDKQETLEELLTFNISLLTPDYMLSIANQLAELALMCNSNPMVALKYRAVLINPPSYFAKYLENALLDKGLKPLYRVDNQYIAITEKTELPNVNIELTQPMSFEELKQFKFQEIANARWEEETQPYYYEPKDASFDTSERSQIKFIQAMADNESIPWKTEDGWIVMTHEDFVGLVSSYKEYVRVLFAKEALLTQQIMACETIEELENINWNNN